VGVQSYPPKRTQYPLLASSYNKSSTKGTGSQLLVNMYLEEVPDTSFYSDVAAIGTPGTTLVLANSGGSVRGSITYNSTAYIVIDSTLYQLTTDSSNSAILSAPLGTLSSSVGRVVIRAIYNQLELADGYNVYNYNILTNTFTTVSDVSLPANCTQILAMDGYFLFFTPNSQKVWVSDPNDGTKITATHFFSTNTSYDYLVSGEVSNGILYFFNQYTTTCWSDTGQTTTPFTPIQGGIHNIGCAAQYTPLVVADAVYFLAQSAKGVLGIGSISGINMTIIQNRALAERINSFTNYSDAFGWTDTINGHVMYNITFPTARGYRGETWSYDTTTQAFFQRTTYNPSAAYYPDFDRYIANCCFTIGQRQYVGDFQTGNIYLLDPTNYTDNGQVIQREVISPHFIMENCWFRIYKLEIDLEKGIGLTTGQGSDPLIRLQVSKDKGNTWSNFYDRSATAIGNYKNRARWASLGGGRTMTMKLTMTDPVKWVIVNATMEVELEQHAVPPSG